MADSEWDHPHIVWRRLKRSEKRGQGNRTIVRPQPPLRKKPYEDRQQVGDQAEAAIIQIDAQRRSVGVHPEHLLVLEMEFVQAAQRELLEKMGARILDEGEKRVPLGAHRYCVM